MDEWTLVKGSIFMIAGNFGWLIASLYLAQDAKEQGKRFDYIFWRVSYYSDCAFVAFHVLFIIATIFG